MLFASVAARGAPDSAGSMTPLRRYEPPCGVPSSWLIASTSVPAYGDKIESPDGTQRHGPIPRIG